MGAGIALRPGLLPGGDAGPGGRGPGAGGAAYRSFSVLGPSERTQTVMSPGSHCPDAMKPSIMAVAMLPPPAGGVGGAAPVGARPLAGPGAVGPPSSGGRAPPRVGALAWVPTGEARVPHR